LVKADCTSELLVEATSQPNVVESAKTIVDTMRFDSFATHMRLSPGLLVKIDAEGADFRVLDGMRDTLSNRLCTIQIELYPALVDVYTNPTERLCKLATDYTLIDVGVVPRIRIGAEEADIASFVNHIRARATPWTDVFLVPKRLVGAADLVDRIIGN
jgi:hypothetical protein